MYKFVLVASLFAMILSSCSNQMYVTKTYVEYVGSFYIDENDSIIDIDVPVKRTIVVKK